MKRIISHFITLTLLMLCHAHTAAAYETEFKIVEGLDDNALKEIMEKNVNGMIQAFKTAADEQKKISDGLFSDPVCRHGCICGQNYRPVKVAGFDCRIRNGMVSRRNDYHGRVGLGALRSLSFRRSRGRFFSDEELGRNVIRQRTARNGTSRRCL